MLDDDAAMLDDGVDAFQRQDDPDVDDAGGQSLVAMSSDGQSFVDGLRCVVLSVSILMTTDQKVLSSTMMTSKADDVKADDITYASQQFCLFTLCYKINLNHMWKVIVCV